jgi:signal transduction histidine kinase
MGKKRTTRSRLAELVCEIDVHEHLCFVYETQRQRFSASVPFLKRGLERGEKCMYIAKGHAESDAFRQAMSAQGVDVNWALEKGQLVFAHSSDPDLKQIVEPDSMIRFLAKISREVKASGLPALRLIGEMTWARNLRPGPEALIEYEAKLNDFLHQTDCVALCQYNRKAFSPEVILGVLRTHPIVIHGELISKNPYYVRPEELLEPRRGDQEVQRLLKNIEIYDAMERKRRGAEEEVHRLSGRILVLQDEERRKIARDLHDSTSQDLVAVAAMLSQLHDSPPSSRDRLRRIVSKCQAVVDRSIQEVRTLSYLLHPPILEKSGLEDAIRDYVEGFSERSGIRVKFESTPDLARMPRETELGLFRVVQEGLTNIQRHSGSRQAKIRIASGPERVTLEVSDKGHGIRRVRGKQSAASRLGVGIPSMQERVQQIGGSLEIESSNQGTTVRVMIPKQ